MSVLRKKDKGGGMMGKKRLIASAKREPEAITNNIELLLSDFKDELYKRLEKEND